MPSPFDNIGALTQSATLSDPGAAFTQGLLGAQQQQQNANTLAAQQAKAQAEAQYQAALQNAIANPTPRSFAALSLINPDAHEAIKSGWDMLEKDVQQTALRDLSSVYGYATSGNADAARKVIQNHIDADKAAGHDTTQYDQMIGLLDDEDGLKKVAGIAGILLSSAVPDKFAETFKEVGASERANAKLPAEVDLAQAQADEARVKADLAPKVIASDLATEDAQRARLSAQTANEIAQQSLGWAKLNLDKDALTTNTQLKLQELGQKAGTLDAGATSAINTAVMSAQTNQALADRASSLADQFAATPMSGGWMSSARTAWKGAFGSQDEVSGLRQAFQALTNSQAVKNLPPGPASDKDIQLAKQGFPPPNAGKEYVVSFLRGMAKMQTVAAEADDRRANWIASNKSLAPAKSDLDVGGVRIPAGTTFLEFNRNAGKIGNQGTAPPRDYITKYGGR